MALESGLAMATVRNKRFSVSGNGDRPAYPGFIVTKTAVVGTSGVALPEISTAEAFDKSPSWINRNCCATADSAPSSNRLNSSKQPHAPVLQRPRSNRPVAPRSKASSQLKTTTCRPHKAPSARTDSVLPVPAGPTGLPPNLHLREDASVAKQRSVSCVLINLRPIP